MDTWRRLEKELVQGLAARGSKVRAIPSTPTVGPALAAQIARAGFPLLFLCAEDDQARALSDDLAFFIGSHLGSKSSVGNHPIAYLPAPENSPYAEVEPDRLAVMRRFSVLFRLLHEGGPICVVASLGAATRKTLPPQEFEKHCQAIRLGEPMDRDRFARDLAAAGFNRTPLVDDPGTYAVRGAVVDLFVPLYKHPIRVEFDDDRIVSLRLFDASTQRSLGPIERIMLHPVRETIPTAGADPRSRLLAAADQATLPSSKTRHLIERIESGERFFGMDCLIPIFHASMASVFDYLPPNTCLVLDEPEQLLEAAQRELVHLRESAVRKRESHQIALEPEEFVLSREGLELAFSGFRRLELQALEWTQQTKSTAPGVALPLKPQALSTATLRAELLAKPDLSTAIQERLKGWIQEGYAIVQTVPDQVHADRLAGLLGSFGFTARRESIDRGWSDLEECAEHSGTITIAVGTLHHGMILPEDGLLLVTEEELFGPRSRRPPPPRAADVFSDLSSIRENDLVVHDEQGVGRYKGLVRLSAGGVTQDFVHLQYDGGVLYLPVYRVGVLRRYSGGEVASARLDKLGGTSWTEKRKRVRTETRKLAEELLQLYAQRKALPGHAFPEPDAMFREFEETFPFEETPDQARAIEAVLGDMMASTPMDRLICGDVGYGKTEVALRAALLAVLGGKQVVVLCPTTVLCEQHLRTFTQRFQGFPVRVSALSRFRPPSEQRSIVAKLAKGQVDIVVGTHRLLSKDVTFKDLGLLIVDEEQRFGVVHKERIKEIRSHVDVLTLTATPIPRTLHMSLAGMREISVIATAPADRLAIRTFICHFDRELLSEAIAKEIERGGQVFFLHNRVEDLATWAREIRTLVPKARVAMAHGQMETSRLEKTMIDFVAGEYDVLCCTTIIESGLDIPRANTLIVHEADRFGLAQLYQVRGRIGRSHLRAYCYLVLPSQRQLQGEAQERLAILQRFTELGAGFQIATADLELRGAGELLGAKQSGLLAAVGFDTYTRILEEAVGELQGQPIREEHDPEVIVDVPAYLPDDYIPDTGSRLETYRQLGRAGSEDDVQALLESLRDRYGPLPPEAELLGEVMVAKTLVRTLGARAFELGPLRMMLALGADTRLDPGKIMRLLRLKDSRWKLTPDMRLFYAFLEKEQKKRLATATLRLRELCGLLPG